MVTSELPSISAFAGRTFSPVGAVYHDAGVSFRVWAPGHDAARAVTGDGTETRYITLEREAGSDGYWLGRDDHGKPGDLYWIQLDGKLLPDPASRFQPRGVEGPSQVVDPKEFEWRVTDWRRPPFRGRIIYELHVGTFTPEGTFAAAAAQLGALVDLGVNTIELMPLGDFAGERNWGYDGVMLFAPARCYGKPDELRALIDAAHARGLAVIVDVVYNHLGPCGNVLPSFSGSYFRKDEVNPWGAGLNFNGPQSAPVRDLFLQNACMWFDEFRVDGLRLDAVHAIHDRSQTHLVTEIAAAAHERGGFVIAEDERNDARIFTPENAGGWGADGMWTDDFHHSLRVGLTHQRESYFANYSGSLDELVATLRQGWFYQGQYYRSWRRERGTAGGHIPPERFVFCISNHDQVGNRPFGDRLSHVVTPEAYRAASTLLCMVPYTPMLFMGQEWAASSPFPFFTDLPGDVGANIAANRFREFQHFSTMYPPEVLARMPDPQAEATFQAAKLKWTERNEPLHAGVLALYRECLHLRAKHLHFQSPPRDQWEVRKVSDSVIELRWRAGEHEWLLLAAFSGGKTLAPPDRERWELVISSNAERFGSHRSHELSSPGATLWRSAKP